MKKIFITVVAVFCIQLSYGQAVETMTKLSKVEQPAATMEIAVGADIAEEIVKTDLKDRGFGKGDESKGFRVYKGISFNEISAEKIDLYIKVEKRSKKDKENSVITAMVSKGYDNFVSSAKDAKAMTALLTYLNNLKPKFNTGSIKAQIAEQEDVVKKEEKKQAKLADDVSDTEKKIAKLQEQVAELKRDVEKQKSEVEKARAALETLKAKQ